MVCRSRVLAEVTGVARKVAVQSLSSEGHRPHDVAYKLQTRATHGDIELKLKRNSPAVPFFGAFLPFYSRKEDSYIQDKCL